MSTAVQSTSVKSTVDPDQLTYDDRGLLPAIAQDVASGAVLMLAWANREAVAATLGTGEAHFFSRSRQELWRKGATSGNVLEVVEVIADCDADSLLYRVLPKGPACHQGTRSCFEPCTPQLELGWLHRVLVARRDDADTESSYTAKLLAAGRPRIAQKVAEEAAETVIASLTEPDFTGGELVGESSDLLYHLLVLLLDCGVPPLEVAKRLAGRHSSASLKGLE